jgi:hypothetical protein
MNSFRNLLCLSMASLLFAATASAQTLVRARYDTPASQSSSMIHTKARFLYNGKNMGTVNNATAILFDATDVNRVEEAGIIAGGRFSVKQAQRVCTARVPGKADTVGLGGDVNFDYVLRGDYSILVCTQVKFRGIAKPVWVAGVASIGRQDFTWENRQQYNMTKPLQIVLDPYAKELKTKPLRLNLPVTR